MNANVIPLATMARDDAIKRVDRNADAEWKAAALDVVRFLSERGKPFTSDAVHFLLARDYNVTTHEPRALGAIMRRATKLGLIEPTDEWRLSVRPECHRRPVRVWKPVPAGSRS